jgi:hypothetical protein
MSTIKEIVQIGVGMPDRETFARFSHEILGFPITNSPDGTVTYMRVDRYPHRPAARTAPEPVLNYIAFDVGGPDALAEWKTKLAAKDVDWRAGNREECLERQVADFIELKDPDIEIPLNPFMGIMAVSPPTSLGMVSSMPPGAWGGNIDLKFTGIGSSLYLPVFNKGAQFFTGDGHGFRVTAKWTAERLKSRSNRHCNSFCIRASVLSRRELRPPRII